jgi:hypothetical protein
MAHLALLAFWHLGSASMLLWAAAALLPILIHLWSRRRYQSTDWAAMTFLMAALRQNARRVRLEQWLLLAVRTAMLLLFALALADPMSSVLSSIRGAGQGGQTHTLLVLDGSYSMDYRDQTETRFERAKQYARELVENASQGDGFTILMLAEPPKVIVGQPAFDRSDLLQEIDALTLTHSAADLPATLAAAEAIVRETDERYPRLARRQVVFLTDLQRSTWEHAAAAEGRARLRRLAELATLSVVDLGGAADKNVTVTRFESQQPIATVGGTNTFQVEVQNHSAEGVRGERVTLRVDGQLVAEQRVDLQPAERATISFDHRFDSPGEHMVEVRLAEDRLEVDNHRWLSVPVQETIRVLCVYGQPGETNYLALALEPQEGAERRVKAQQAAESAIVESDLENYDCVVLSNVGRINRDEAAVLRRFVTRGGGLIVFLGDRVQADSYNQQLGELAGDARLLPASLGETSSESQYRLNPLDYRHSIVSPFRGHEKSGLLTTPIWSYIRLQPSSGAKVALAFDNGDPALVEEQIGQGRVILFASAASPLSVNRTSNPPTPWTAIASWPSFPPLVQEMLNLSLSGRTAGRNQIVGDDLRGDVSKATPETPVEIVLPDGQEERLPLVMDAAGAHWFFTSATQSGPYEVKIGSPVSTVERFSLNIDPRESDLERLSFDSLPPELTSEPAKGGTRPTSFGEPLSRSYFRELLLAVIGLALVDVMLAWRLGRGAA